ncbi:membrane protein [Mycolicibacterium aromaticivorans JS19b1 = JCM 16368]|uniref:Membrane protein n=1 Tax=Mycolicibacterium aromaticivorans JS19b1 = JCM 16368 TaxID=1440774 RepID=A0A064CQW4_9MYCO|nr:hemolysin III family protein [Mycolicibacterium aromaticivorans]KDF01203.1 membrane protein [Mycolicibacterium aromaticivorans JS19b1 = JCM 16368]
MTFEKATPPPLPSAPAGIETIADVLGTPRVRGWIHLSSAVVAIIASAALMRAAFAAASPNAGWVTAIYTTTVVAMFGVSATYHLVRWRSPRTLTWMKRADHSMIFVFIVGTYFPVAVLAMPQQTATRVLTIVCVAAAVGIALKMLWPSAPRWIGVPLYLMLGYAAIAFARTILDGAGLTVVGLLVAGGVLYNIGAVLYGLRWPNPWPASFGYHEFFHAFTAAAATCHYVAIWLIVAGVAMS